MNKRIRHLNPELKPLVEGETPTAERPHVEWINLSHEEYEALFQPWPTFPKTLTTKDEDER